MGTYVLYPTQLEPLGMSLGGRWHYFADGIFLGESGRERCRYKQVTAHCKNTLYVCPKCGDIWGTIVRVDAESEYIPLRRLCRRHGGGFLVDSGSPGKNIDGLPYDALARELSIALDNHAWPIQIF
jgi:hypothetical protein